MDEIFKGIDGVCKLIDDTEASSIEQMQERMEKVLKQAKDNNITILRQIQFESPVKLGGFLIDNKDGQTSMRPNPNLLKDIRKFKTHMNISEVQAFTGLAKTISDYNPDMS